MAREDSKMMQGVAILMMIFYHCFNPNDIHEAFSPVLQTFASVNNPVPLYTLLSGYGFYKVYQRRKKDLHRVSRCLKLYSIYWMTMTTFLLIGFVGGGIYTKHDCYQLVGQLYRLAVYVLPAVVVYPSLCHACNIVSVDYESN